MPRLCFFALLFLPAFLARADLLTTLDGTVHEGEVSISDRYYIRLSSDSGIIHIPLASLTEADLRRLGCWDNRGQDARFWWERREAIRSSNRGGELSAEARSAQGDVYRKLDLVNDYARVRAEVHRQSNEARLDQIAQTVKQRIALERSSAIVAIHDNRKAISRIRTNYIPLQEKQRAAVSEALGKTRHGSPNNALYKQQLASLDRNLALAAARIEFLEDTIRQLQTDFEITAAELGDGTESDPSAP